MTNGVDAQAMTSVIPVDAYHGDAVAAGEDAVDAGAAGTAVVALTPDLPAGPAIAGISDAEVLARLEQAFTDRRRADAVIARLAGEIADRSRHSLGAEGLARRYGAANPAGLVASVGLVSQADARRYCRVGEATAPRTTLGGDPLPPAYPVVAQAVGTGAVSIEAAQSIVAALDAAAPRAVAEDLEAAEHELMSFATVGVPEDVRKLAARWRDALDVDGVEPREEALVAARALRKVLLPNGLTRFTADLDPLSAA